MPSYGFHADALGEYSDATFYYLENASSLVAAGFVAEVEAAISTILASPETWRIAEEPEIRRYLVQHYPYAIYYRWRPESQSAQIYAVMHLSRKPGYWRDRLDG